MIKKFPQKCLITKSKFVLKIPTRAQIIRYFRYESRNKKASLFLDINNTLIMILNLKSFCHSDEISSESSLVLFSLFQMHSIYLSGANWYSTFGVACHLWLTSISLSPTNLMSCSYISRFEIYTIEISALTWRNQLGKEPTGNYVVLVIIVELIAEPP